MPTASHQETSVTKAFDSAARSYDATFEFNGRTRRIREKIHSLINTLAVPPSAVLDINCGTGTDAVLLATMGYNVVGVDLSPLMINEARRKSGGLGNVRFHEGTYHDLSVLKDDRFDVVLSNFGGLNCTSDITGAAAEVARFLKPAGYFVAVVMPPVSLWDVGAKVAKGRFATVARRAVLRETTADFEGGSIRVYYHSPAALSRGFKPFFRRGDLIGLNIFGPPPRNGRFATTFKWISQALDRVDDLTGHLPIVRSLGDHYVAVFQKAEKR